MSKQEQLELLYDARQISARTAELAAEISRDFSGRDMVCVCVLSGAFQFFSELVRHFGAERECAFLSLSSYQNGLSSSGEVELSSAWTYNVAGRNVLVVEDIVDSGRTVQFLRDFFQKQGAACVRVACLLDKPDGRVVDAAADYTAFTLSGDGFVVGYGLDLAQKYRCLPAVYRLKKKEL